MTKRFLRFSLVSPPKKYTHGGVRGMTPSVQLSTSSLPASFMWINVKMGNRVADFDFFPRLSSIKLAFTGHPNSASQRLTIF